MISKAPRLNGSSVRASSPPRTESLFQSEMQLVQEEEEEREGEKTGLHRQQMLTEQQSMPDPALGSL